MSINLSRIIYTSLATVPDDDKIINKILKQARKNNIVDNVTGILLLCNNRFFQILEGQGQVIDEMYRKIQTDIRHTNLNIIVNEKITKRAFYKTSMGFINLNQHNQIIAQGLSNFQVASNFLKSFDVEASKDIDKSFLLFNEIIH